MTVTGIDFDTDTNTGSLNIVDPWAATGDLTAPDLLAELTVNNNELILGYTGGGAGNDGDNAENPNHSGFGFITGIAAESVVTPLPPALYGGALAVVGLVFAGRRRAARIL